MSISACANQVRLTISDASGNETSSQLPPDSSVLVGNSEGCKIRLQGEKVSPKHCLIRFGDGRLTIQDWFSDEGTLLNGRKTEGEEEVKEGDTISIGSFLMVARFTHAPLEEKEGTCLPEVVEPNSQAETKLDDALESNELQTSEPSTPESQVSSKPATAGIPSKNPAMLNMAAWNQSPVDDERIQILEAELELLQSELAERDARLEELEALDHFDTSDAGLEDSDDGVMQNRLNELLDELARSDQRTKALEDLLLLSEDAARAEQDERSQIEAWMNDLESRICDREAEWQAEIETLNSQKQELMDVISHMETRLMEIVSNTALEAQERTIKELQQEIEQCKEELARTKKESELLQRDMRTTDMESIMRRQKDVVEEAVREEQLRIAQERADFSRQKAELVKRVSDLEHQLNKGKPIRNEADQKFLAFREHLKEIHENQLKNPPKAPSLTKRLKDLWNRLDGPTDTD